ncbi:MAG TPA: aminopeptidase P family protein [Thermoplasmata archaeon]|nr:aminopeptidase P family protein [Thermoplasmata archaeon]
MKERIKRVFSLIDDAINLILLKNSGCFNPSFFYITGLAKGFFEDTMTVVWRDGNVEVFISQLDLVGDAPSHVTFHPVKSVDETKKKMEKSIDPSCTVGFDGRYLTHADYKFIRKMLPKRRLRDISRDMIRVRLIKDRWEVENIKQACSVVSRVATEIPEMLCDGATEHEVAAEIDYRVRRYGGEKEAFETIVAFGENSAMPHYTRGGKQLKRGDLVLVDFGASVNRYVSDISRTFVYGKSNSQQRRMYEVVLHAQQEAIDSIKEEATFESIHKAVQNFIDNTEFKGRFIHSTGHTLGLEVHDGFSITTGCKEKFSSGMVFTVEPGVYLPSVGGVRIEDDLFIDKGRVKVLTSAPKEFEV